MNALPRVVKALNEAKVPFVMAGDRALAFWTNEPCAAKEVDVIVSRRRQRKAAWALRAAFPDLDFVDGAIVKRLQRPRRGTVVINVRKPTDWLHCAMFRHTHAVHAKYGAYRIPSLEMAMTLTYSSIASLYRSDVSKYRDKHEFALLIQRHPDFDCGKLWKLADLVCVRGGTWIMKHVQQVRADDNSVL